MRSEALGRVRSAWPGTAVALLTAVLVAGCGSNNFPNEPRPPAPIETTASIGPRHVDISPDTFGAGIVNVTVANLSDGPASLILKNDAGKTKAQSGTLQPSSVTTIKTNLGQGTYQAIAGGATGIRPGKIKVGPERKSSQNDLLLP
jgi:hypothetical protein